MMILFLIRTRLAGIIADVYYQVLLVLILAVDPTACNNNGDLTCYTSLGLHLLQVAFFFFSSHIYFPASGPQAVVTGVVPPPPRFLPSIFSADRVQQSHCSSIFHRVSVLLTHALALSASQLVHNQKSPRTYTSMYALGGV